MKLIKELNEDVQYMTEESSDAVGGKNYFIEGIIMQSNLKNRNGRVYPKEVLMKEMNRYNEVYVNRNRAYGELGHPNGPTINLDRVSHMFTELREDGDNIVGRAKIMDTPMGRIVKNFIDEGAQLGISSRGLGSMKKNRNGIMEVQGDFMLATAGDIVSDPSGPDCYVQGIMEGAEWIFDVGSNSWVEKLAEDIQHEEEVEDNHEFTISEEMMKQIVEATKTAVMEEIKTTEMVVEKHVKELKENKIDEERSFEMFREFIQSLKQ